MPDHPHGQSLRFRVKIDGDGDLGNWSKCDGLAVEYDVFEYKEGGENAFIHRIPGRAKYQNIKLTRPINQDTRSDGRRRKSPRSTPRVNPSRPGTSRASSR